jgi:hypothetical protein
MRLTPEADEAPVARHRVGDTEHSRVTARRKFSFDVPDDGAATITSYTALMT